MIAGWADEAPQTTEPQTAAVVSQVTEPHLQQQQQEINKNPEQDAQNLPEPEEKKALSGKEL